MLAQDVAVNRVFLRNLKPVTCFASARCVSLLEQGPCGDPPGLPCGPRVSSYSESPASHSSPHALISQDGTIGVSSFRGFPTKPRCLFPLLCCSWRCWAQTPETRHLLIR